MRHLYLPLLLILPLFPGPVPALGADVKPKAAGTDQSTDGAKAPQKPAANHDSTELKADSDANKADSDQADSDHADSDQADTDKPKQPRKGSRPTSMAVLSVRGGQKTLTIHFRWFLYPNCSIEVRLVPGPEQKGATVAPIYFSEHLKGKVRDALYKCLDHPGEGGWTHSFTKDKLVYKMIGRRNSLGNQGVHVQVHPENIDTAEANPAAAYLQLDTWAVDRDTLSLDLARDEFAKSGTLFVWFFRGDQVVWEEQILWPGYGRK